MTTTKLNEELECPTRKPPPASRSTSCSKRLAGGFSQTATGRPTSTSQKYRFVILSNGNLHYFWDLERGNPYLITSFPTPASVVGYRKVTPDPQRLISEPVGDDYIVLTQRPTYQSEAGWKKEVERAKYRTLVPEYVKDYVSLNRFTA